MRGVGWAASLPAAAGMGYGRSRAGSCVRQQATCCRAYLKVRRPAVSFEGLRFGPPGRALSLSRGAAILSRPRRRVTRCGARPLYPLGGDPLQILCPEDQTRRRRSCTWHRTAPLGPAWTVQNRSFWFRRWAGLKNCFKWQEMRRAPSGDGGLPPRRLGSSWEEGSIS